MSSAPDVLHSESPLGFIANLDNIEIKIGDCSVTSHFENKIKVRMMLSSKGKNNFHLCISSVKFHWNPLKVLLFMASALVTVVTVLTILECLPTSDISVKHMYNHTCLFIYRLMLLYVVLKCPQIFGNLYVTLKYFWNSFRYMD